MLAVPTFQVAVPCVKLLDPDPHAMVKGQGRAAGLKLGKAVAARGVLSREIRDPPCRAGEPR